MDGVESGGASRGGGRGRREVGGEVKGINKARMCVEVGELLYIVCVSVWACERE